MFDQHASRIGVQGWRLCSVRSSTTPEEKVKLPPDFLSCMEEYEQHDCNMSGCTWCNTEVGLGFCMADAAARAMSECNFFSCDTEASDKKKKYDSVEC